MDCSGILYLLNKYAPAERPRFPPAKEIRIEAARAVMNKRYGRGWTIPAYAVKTIKEVYDEVGTIEKTGAIFGVGGDAISKLFKRNGIAILPPPLPTMVHNGVKYRYDGSRYYVKCGRGNGGILLHKVIWEERNGPVPKDHWIVFRTENKADFSPENMYLLPRKKYFAHILRTRWDRHRARLSAQAA